MIDLQDRANAHALPLVPSSSSSVPSARPQQQRQRQDVSAEDIASGRRTTEQDEAIVGLIEDRLYRDYSQVTPEDVAADLAAAHGPGARRAADAYFLPASIYGGSSGGAAAGQGYGGAGASIIFPAKLHEMLADPEAQGLVEWLPHGRAWKILDAARFGRSALLSRYFSHGNLRSFMRLVSGWGFRRVERGRDTGAYYHQLFLRGMTHLSALMSRRAIKTRRGERRSIFAQLRGITPDFYRISEQFPLPRVPFAPPPSARRALASSLRQAVPDGAISSSSTSQSAPSLVVAESVASSGGIVAEPVRSSHSAPSMMASTRRGSGSLTNDEWGEPASGPPPHLLGRRPLPALPRPDPVESSSSRPLQAARDVRPDSPTSVMSHAVLSAPASSEAPQAMGASQVSSHASALATEALQRYIARNAILSHPLPLYGGSGAAAAPSAAAPRENASGGGGGGGGVPLSVGSEVFLRRLRERADLIESLRSIMHR